MKMTKLTYTLIAFIFLGACTTPDNFKNGKYEKEPKVESYILTPN